jgi:hypothetical protein
MTNMAKVMAIRAAAKTGDAAETVLAGDVRARKKTITRVRRAAFDRHAGGMIGWLVVQVR